MIDQINLKPNLFEEALSKIVYFDEKFTLAVKWDNICMMKYGFCNT